MLGPELCFPSRCVAESHAAHGGSDAYVAQRSLLIPPFPCPLNAPVCLAPPRSTGPRPRALSALRGRPLPFARIDRQQQGQRHASRNGVHPHLPEAPKVGRVGPEGWERGRFEVTFVLQCHRTSATATGREVPSPQNKAVPKLKVLFWEPRVEVRDRVWHVGLMLGIRISRGWSSPSQSIFSSHLPLSFCQPSFVESLQRGASLQIAVALDFTKSNLQPEVPGSLHYLLGQPGKRTWGTGPMRLMASPQAVEI